MVLDARQPKTEAFDNTKIVTFTNPQLDADLLDINDGVIAKKANHVELQSQNSYFRYCRPSCRCLLSGLRRGPTSSILPNQFGPRVDLTTSN